jgi:ATP-dependent Lon protease
VAFDLSQVLFITTANLQETIPGPLLDRMEVIHISSYTEQEKLEIAKAYLVPRQLRENGLRPQEISFQDESITSMIRHYTREAGVRSLEREIGSVCRKVVTGIAEGKLQKCEITLQVLEEFLGRPRFFPTAEVEERTSLPGVATALAWTPTGGDLLFIEATQMPGRRGFMLTGSLGQVMQESAHAALSFVRSKSKELGLAEDFFDRHDIHLHIPAGAQPKDGPSAGITIATALVSLLSGKPVRPEVGMTGEITLRGQVLPIGGVKEKVLAAHRAGLRTVILPKHNQGDLDDLPKEVREDIRFVFVDTVDEVLQAALEPPVSRNGRGRHALKSGRTLHRRGPGPKRRAS